MPTLTKEATKQPMLPSEYDSTLAGAGLELLQNETEVILRLEGQDKTLTLSAPMVKLLQRIFEEMARGKALDVVSLETELTTQQAADVLNVSRPFVVKLLDEGALPHRLVGSHRRVLLKDVLAHKNTMQRRSEAAIQELSRLSQEMGTY